jgi:hypothetical protein
MPERSQSELARLCQHIKSTGTLGKRFPGLVRASVLGHAVVTGAGIGARNTLSGPSRYRLPRLRARPSSGSGHAAASQSVHPDVPGLDQLLHRVAAPA